MHRFCVCPFKCI